MAAEARDFSYIPMISVAGLGRGDAAATDRVVAEIGAACETAGFFYVVDHGVPHDAIDAIFVAARAFFALPQAMRDAIDVHSSRNFRGYVPMGFKGSGVPLRQLEAFQIMLDLGPDDPDVKAGSVMHGPNVWPSDGPDFSSAAFRAALERYQDAVWRLSERLLGAFALALGQERDYFRGDFRKPLTQLRVLHYPPQRPEEEAQGVEAHTDPGAFTILLQDSVGGLEARNRAGQWIPAPPVAHSFVINIGDMMQRWTNGRFVSTPHRVANRTGRDRISAPFFVNPGYDATIAPALGGAARAQPLYEPLACGPYIEAAYRAAWPDAG
jgi:isopenicillin N synthase-like dioxygenase